MWPDIPPDVPEWVYYACVGAAVIVIGIAKAGFGGGIGILAVPLMGSVMPADQMLGVMLPTLIVADILSNLHYLKDYDWDRLKPMLGGAIAGIVLASGLLYLLRDTKPDAADQWLKIIVGAICLIFVGLQAYGLTGREVPTLPAHSASRVAIGWLAGFVSTFSHSAGPIASLYLLQEKLEKRALVATLLLFFLIVNLVKLPTYLGIGLINGQSLRNSIWFIPLIPLGTLAGAWMNKYIKPLPFVIIMYTAAAVTSAVMIAKAVA